MLKTIIKVVMLLAISLSIALSDGSFRDEIQAQKNIIIDSSKLSIIIISTDDCHWCDKMKATTLKNKTVKELFKSFNIIYMMKDECPEELFTTAAPAMIFLNEKFDRVGENIGYINSEELIPFLRDALK